ncbi:stage II sporulation protein P [Virgibacillus phasianinus]|uniref:Stage II sporulation protein P n=1 Tax=Virgibacillus phasianinus TaxID=2017483 RepID=A0A220TZX9_9BACI|nr:stage II sporulation protein P [Virgibacillus phasianinus]ASK61340.1 stage II sporulation protein P [Virgibacillus phasianinus]
MKNKYTKDNNPNLFIITIGLVIVLFTTSLIISIPSVQIKILQSKGLEQLVNSEPFTNTFLFLLGEEIPQFKTFLGDEIKTPSLSKLALEAVTGIKTDNITTLMMQEIPGFNIANTEIYIAGEGSNYSNLPHESPPPDFDKLLKGHQPTEEKEPTSHDSNDTDKIKDPSVYIYHSHSWEGYLPLIDEDVKPSDSSSIDNSENVVLVGTMLTNKFEEYGINTVHNSSNVAKALRDRGWDYRNSYTLTHEYVETAASKNPTMDYYIDIHRDSARKESTTATINGKSYARLYFVVGKANEHYQENLSFAKEIHQKLEESYPGLSKGIYVKTKAEGNGVYNQDISSKSLLIEVGGIDNNKEELANTVGAFADVFEDIYEGVVEVNAQK